MKAGDLVRFRDGSAYGDRQVSKDQSAWLVGLLIEYHTWEKITTVMHKDKILRISARNVEKFGKKGLKNGKL
jgi:hypothetical protein